MSNAPEKGGVSLPGQVVNGTASVRVTPDGMEAWLHITPPGAGGQPVTHTQALAALTKAGVTFGIDSAAVERLVKEVSEQTIGGKAKQALVAKGKPPVRGMDASITYNELLQTPSGYPLQRDDGSVDFYELNLVRNVPVGVVLATRQPPTKGTPGTNVTGASVPGQDGREYVLKAGRGAKVSEDGCRVSADLEGHAKLSHDGRITVSPIFEIRGDVDTSTGNIDFVGTVIVMGNVNHGFTVKAGQNVQVGGGIDGGTVEAGGDLVVRYGIQGAGRGKVVVGGKIQCRFMENADVRAGRDVTVSDGILHSKLRCSGKVTVTGRRGSVIGGSVKARDEVSARIIGSSLTTTTEIEVGVSPETRDEYEAVRRQLLELEEGLRKAQQAVTLLRELEQRNPQEFTVQRREMLMKALRSQYHYRGQRDQLMVRKAALEQELQTAQKGRVRAYDYAYPGVKVTIGNENYLVVDTLQRVSFYLDDDHQVSIGSA